MMEEHYISKRLYRKKTIEEVDRKIKLLGTSTKLNPFLFLNIRFWGMILLFIVVFYFSGFGYLVAPICAFIYYKGVTYLLLDQKIKNRQVELEQEALSFFEILTLSLETGRNLQDALKVTLSSCEGVLVDEFRSAMGEVRFGKSLTEALEDMQKCIPSDTINNIILSLTQANLYGSSIIKSLYGQIDYLREKRKLEVKAFIAKVPIKISILSVFFFIPLVLIIILAPVLLNYLYG